MEAKLERIKSNIGVILDFPKPGIVFRDIFTVLRNPPIFKDLIDLMTDHLKSKCAGVSVIVGLEARGFLFGPILAHNLGIAFVPIRKKGKLPGEVCKVKYCLEYGEDCFEAQKCAIQPGEKVVIVDDLLATGGTMNAACELIESMQGELLEGFVVIELVDLKGREKCRKPVTSLIKF